jgi:hypothetical protein
MRPNVKGETMQDFASFGAIVVFFLLVDQVVNIFKQLKTDWKVYEFWAALGVSVALTVLAGMDMFAAAGFEFALPYVGAIATGIAGSRGANYMHDGFKAVRAIAATNKAKVKQKTQQ